MAKAKKTDTKSKAADEQSEDQQEAPVVSRTPKEVPTSKLTATGKGGVSRMETTMSAASNAGLPVGDALAAVDGQVIPKDKSAYIGAGEGETGEVVAGESEVGESTASTSGDGGSSTNE